MGNQGTVARPRRQSCGLCGDFVFGATEMKAAVDNHNRNPNGKAFELPRTSSAPYAMHQCRHHNHYAGIGPSILHPAPHAGDFGALPSRSGASDSRWRRMAAHGAAAPHACVALVLCHWWCGAAGTTRVLDTTSEPGAGKGTARRPGRYPRLTSHARDACRDACAHFPSLLPPGQGKEHSTFQQCFYCRTARVHVRGVPMPVLLCQSCSRSYATPHSNLCTAFN